jgi:hypothetical protein
MVNNPLLSHGFYNRSSAGCIYPNSKELGGSPVAMTGMPEELPFG